MEEIWKEIPGLPGYCASDMGRVKHIRKDEKETILKRNRRQVSVRVNGRSTTIAVGKAMYSAFNGIDIFLLQNVRTIGDVLTELRVLDIGSFLEEARKSRNKINLYNVEKVQMEAYEDLKAVIATWETKDSTVLFERIKLHESDIINYAHRNFNLKIPVVVELWNDISLTLVEDIMYKRRAVGAFRLHLKLRMKGLIFKRRELIRKHRETNDNREYNTH